MRAPSARRVSSVGSLTPERAVAVQFSAFHLERERGKEGRNFVRTCVQERVEEPRFAARHTCAERTRECDLCWCA